VPSTEISSLTIYPVKSMKGIPLERATLTPAGLSNDRRWMVVRANGRFVTQRDLPRLARVQTSLDEHGVVLAMQAQGSVAIPFEGTDGERIRTRVWGDECETVDEGEQVSRWLTGALDSNIELRLVRMAPGFVRPQSKPDELGEGTTTYFADAAPFLVASETSLEELNRALGSRGHSPVPMNRFRPNIVVRGIPPFSEHDISDISGENYQLDFCHPCERCVVTTIDQDTGVRSPDWQPFNTLKEINPMPGNERAPAFAQNAVLGHGDGAHITVGDLVSTRNRC
jgi:uncharacterized protein YcbX